jgi:hypothetical protein
VSCAYTRAPRRSRAVVGPTLGPGAQLWGAGFPRAGAGKILPRPRRTSGGETAGPTRPYAAGSGAAAPPCSCLPFRSVVMGTSSRTVHCGLCAGPIFQGRPHLSAVIRRLGSSVGNSRYGPYRSPTALAAQVGTVRLSSSWTNLPGWSSWMVPHRGELQPELHPP